MAPEVITLATDTLYAQLLRPVGQALESQRIETFTITIEGEDVLVEGRKRKEPESEIKPLRGLWQLLRGGMKEADLAGQSTWETVAERYTPADLKLMEEAARVNRGTSGGTADAHSPSQILRAVGDFVDQKEGRFLSASKEGQSVTIKYESASKRIVSEEFTVSSLYDYWVRMYLKRSGRPEPQV